MPTRRHDVDAQQRLDCSDEHRGGDAVWFAHEVEHEVVAVREVDVRRARRAVHHRVARRDPLGRGVAARVVGAEIRLDFDDPPAGHRPVHHAREDAAQELPGDDFGRSREELGVQQRLSSKIGRCSCRLTLHNSPWYRSVPNESRAVPSTSRITLMREREESDRRSGRREFHLPERRTGFDRRRREAILGALRDDRFLFGLILVAIVVLSVSDWLLTLRALKAGAVEGNPVLARLITINPGLAAGFKATITLLMALLMWKMRRYRYILAAGLGALLVYWALMAYHLGSLAGLGAFWPFA